MKPLKCGGRAYDWMVEDPKWETTIGLDGNWERVTLDCKRSQVGGDRIGWEETSFRIGQDWIVGGTNSTNGRGQDWRGG